MTPLFNLSEASATIPPNGTETVLWFTMLSQRQPLLRNIGHKAQPSVNAWIRLSRWVTG